tara:strand:+ start:420 stop:644 length:225 start_codon:yes stop_codon:yes gene_type:complete
MENFPYEINYKILEYVYGCRKHNQQIFNKESNGIFLKKTKDCEKINILSKNLCQRCDKKAIWRVRMIMNNLLPG